MFNFWLSAIPAPVHHLRRQLTLMRQPRAPDRQARRDRLLLNLRLWPHFYFNYHFSQHFPQHLQRVCREKYVEKFRHKLLQLLELHYLAAIASFNSSTLGLTDIKHRYFSDMQYGYRSLTQARGDTPTAIIDDTLNIMLYHDVLYSWSTSPLFGPYNSYYSPKSLFYNIQRLLLEKENNLSGDSIEF